MYKISIFVVAIFLFSCTSPTSPPKAVAAIGPHFSRQQQWFTTLHNSLKSECANAPNDSAKAEILAQYKEKLDTYLTDSCHFVIDSMQVNVGDLTPVSPRQYAATFDGDYTRFSCTIPFQDKTDINKDTIYNFIKNLKIASNTIMKFYYLGIEEINDPTGTGTRSFDIKAIPAPLTLTDFGKELKKLSVIK